MTSKRLIHSVITLCTLCSPWFDSSASADLRTLNTPHYRIHTDLDERLATDLATRMDAMYEQYALRMADFNPDHDRRFEVYLLTSREDYTRLTGDRFLNTGGVFIQSRNLLAAFLEGQGRDSLRRTLQHEAFHQFAYTAIGPGVPVWLNEGIAQVFEEGLWTGRQFIIGQVPPRRLRQLQLDLREHRFMPFEQFIAIPEKQWSNDLADPNKSASRYGQAWAMTHFLIFATDETGQPRYRPRLIHMLRLLRDGAKPTDAFVEAFSNNFAGFQQRFAEYIRTLQPTKEATFVEQQAILADLLVALQAQGHRFEDMEAFRQFLIDQGTRLRYTKGDVQWSTSTDPSVYFRDAAGRTMAREQLYLSPRAGAPLPDMVCRPIDGLQYRTIFHDGLAGIDHETFIESR